MGSTQIIVGDYEISVVDDHIGLRRDPSDVFVDVSDSEWVPHRHYALAPEGYWRRSGEGISSGVWMGQVRRYWWILVRVLDLTNMGRHRAIC